MFSIYLLFLCFSISHSSESSNNFSTKDYLTSDDGAVMMNVNIIGNVKNSGSYLVFDGADLLTVLSAAGGYLPGSNLKEITIYRSNGKTEIIDFNIYINSDNINSLNLKPNDTIYIDQKLFSRIISSSNLPTILLSFLNLIVTLERE